MSEIISNLKEALNPKKREDATAPTYDPSRAPYADNTPSQNQLDPPRGEAPTDTETSSVTRTDKMTAPDRPPKAATHTNFNAPEGTYGPHGSRLANALDPRVDSDRDGSPKHGVSGYGGAAAKPERK
ncbi:hypothetical protein QBC34DRAFT_382472 [Podospora aff. communis PSN243]|uniref:Uncharacterized protein n=1 Tax=Podospora aff. communis PSN243 TaxID=3040156 RepID=A0AAV9GH32_9PEZI|nr:hypothetical protein QBC34DRAFT_382472 [Podospora aff. communis PSN243]